MYADFVSGIWCIGLATRKYSVQNELGKCAESWGLRQDGALVHNNTVIEKISTEIEEGDVIVSLQSHHRYVHLLIHCSGLH